MARNCENKVTFSLNYYEFIIIITKLTHLLVIFDKKYLTVLKRNLNSEHEDLITTLLKWLLIHVLKKESPLPIFFWPSPHLSELPNLFLCWFFSISIKELYTVIHDLSPIFSSEIPNICRTFPNRCPNSILRSKNIILPLFLFHPELSFIPHIPVFIYFIFPSIIHPWLKSFCSSLPFTTHLEEELPIPLVSAPPTPQILYASFSFSKIFPILS